MSYTVLARRYRSSTFDEVIGQEHVAQTLKKAIEANRIAHAFLFNGTRGVGKTSMARIMAKALEKDPDVRYQTAADLRSDLKRLERIRASMASSSRPMKPRARPRASPG